MEVNCGCKQENALIPSLVNNDAANGEGTMDSATLFWGVFLGSIGLGFFVYGKKQQAVVPIISGVGLMLIPYVISNMYLLIAAGIALMAVPFFVRL